MSKRIVLLGVVLVLALALLFAGSGLAQASGKSFPKPPARWGIQCVPLPDTSGACGS